jgi:hypothetical protein
MQYLHNVIELEYRKILRIRDFVDRTKSEQNVMRRFYKSAPLHWAFSSFRFDLAVQCSPRTELRFQETTKNNNREEELRVCGLS